MRNMSFMLTTNQVMSRMKTVTRRLGWWFLKPGDIIRAVDKCMGLKKGEHPKKLAIIKIVKVNKEPLNKISQIDLFFEGFYNITQDEFIEMFCKSHKNCTPGTIVNRIEFDYL